MLGESLCKKLCKEQELEVNAWHNKKQAKYNKALFGYVEKKYTQMLRRCPLYQKLAEANRDIKASLGEFVALRKSRDELGRTLKFKPHSHIEEENYSLGYNFGYLAGFTLKKMLLAAVLPSAAKKSLYSAQFLANDFAFKLQRQLFNTGRSARKGHIILPQSPEPTRVRSMSSSENSVSEMGGETQVLNARHTDYIPKSIAL